jgi:1-acyl-sn-glycerol-3-phosphate acyltransferase
LQRQARQILRVLGVEATYVGQPPTEGVMVSNHISYLDIFVHAARAPMTFISKAEVAGWPVFGMLTTWAGTLYIRRERRSDVLRVAAEMPHVLQAGLVLMFFPEGTSSDGSGVLPFRASLLAPLVDNGWRVTPAFLRYGLEPGEGTVADEVAYYRPETAFVPHLFHLLGKRRIRATVIYGEPQTPGTERKALARQLRDAVCELVGLVEAGREA